MPRLPLFFARRYLFSKKSHSVINIVSGVSAFSVAIPVMAMVILLSVFNGFEGLIKSMYRSFDPDIRITPVRGKVFPIDSLPRERFLAIDGVRDAAYALEDNAVFEYRDRQAAGSIRSTGRWCRWTACEPKAYSNCSSEISRKPTSDRAWPTRWASGST